MCFGCEEKCPDCKYGYEVIPLAGKVVVRPKRRLVVKKFCSKCWDETDGKHVATTPRTVIYGIDQANGTNYWDQWRGLNYVYGV